MHIQKPYGILLDMTIEERLAETESRFETVKQRHAETQKAADDMMTELTRIQGEYRLLQQLKDTDNEANKEATAIEAVPEGQ